ncbi:MAG: hypothetical protein JWO41_616 [Candidatus Saccharibacteria bacterium]|nr:hypothetical protein [Candidatus Saccharibacteria bacterium]
MTELIRHLEVVPDPPTDPTVVVIETLLALRHTDPSPYKVENTRFVGLLATGQTWPQLNELSDNINDFVMERHPDKSEDRFDARRAAWNITGESLSWLGTVAFNFNDAETAKNAVLQLRNLGGHRNRKRARRLNGAIKRADHFGHEAPVWGTSN